MSEEPRIRSQKLHCRRCVYLDPLLEKPQKVAEIAYITSMYRSENVKHICRETVTNVTSLGKRRF